MRLVFPILVLLISACSTSTYHVATPIAKGTNEFGVFAGGVLVSPGARSMGRLDDGSSTSLAPHLELTYRRGLTTWSDLGVQVGAGTFQIDYNMAAINTNGFALSIDPQFQTFLFVPIRARIGIHADVLKMPNGAILSLNLSPGFRFDEGPSVGGGILAKLPIDWAFFLIFLDGEGFLKRNGHASAMAGFFSGGVGFAF